MLNFCCKFCLRKKSREHFFTNETKTKIKLMTKNTIWGIPISHSNLIFYWYYEYLNYILNICYLKNIHFVCLALCNFLLFNEFLMMFFFLFSLYFVNKIKVKKNKLLVIFVLCKKKIIINKIYVKTRVQFCVSNFSKSRNFWNFWYCRLRGLL